MMQLQVLHTRSCSGTGMPFVRFLAACYLTFNMDSQSVAKALENLPALPLLHQASGALGRLAACLRLLLAAQYSYILLACMAGSLSACSWYAHPHVQTAAVSPQLVGFGLPAKR